VEKEENEEMKQVEVELKEMETKYIERYSRSQKGNKLLEGAN
jgi:hypothetical protein